MLQTEETVPGLPLHGDGPQPQDAEFFAPPPAEIGEVVSGNTSLRTSHRPRKLPARIGYGVLWAVLTGLAALVLHSMQEAGWSAWTLVVPGAVLGFLGGFLGSTFCHTCSYVGREGIARFTLFGSREARPEPNLFVFSQAEQLHVKVTRHFKNGIYQNTDYHYSWKDGQGTEVHSIRGSYRDKDGPPSSPADDWHLAVRAESAWNDHFLARCLRRLDAGEPVRFPVEGGIILEVGPGYFSLDRKGQAARWNISDLAGIALDQGKVTLTSAKFESAGWVGKMFGAGKVSFDYDKLPNGRVFFLLMDLLVRRQG